MEVCLGASYRASSWLNFYDFDDFFRPFLDRWVLLSQFSSIRPRVRCDWDGLKLGELEAPEHIIKLVPMSSRWCSPLYSPAVFGNSRERSCHYLGDVLHGVTVSIVTLYRFYEELSSPLSRLLSSTAIFLFLFFNCFFSKI